MPISFSERAEFLETTARAKDLAADAVASGKPIQIVLEMKLGEKKPKPAISSHHLYVVPVQHTRHFWTIEQAMQSYAINDEKLYERVFVEYDSQVLRYSKFALHNHTEKTKSLHEKLRDGSGISRRAVTPKGEELRYALPRVVLFHYASDYKMVGNRRERNIQGSFRDNLLEAYKGVTHRLQHLVHTPGRKVAEQVARDKGILFIAEPYINLGATLKLAREFRGAVDDGDRHHKFSYLEWRIRGEHQLFDPPAVENEPAHKPPVAVSAHHHASQPAARSRRKSGSKSDQMGLDL